MKIASLVMLLLLGTVSTTWADELPTPEIASIGGGVAHPWKSPYKTAVSQNPVIDFTK